MMEIWKMVLAAAALGILVVLAWILWNIVAIYQAEVRKDDD